MPPAPEANEFLTQAVVDQIDQFIYGGDANRGKAPPCDPQAPLGRLLGQAGRVPAPRATAVGEQQVLLS